MAPRKRNTTTDTTDGSSATSGGSGDAAALAKASTTLNYNRSSAIPSASPAPTAPGSNRLRLRAPPAFLAVAILVGLWATFAIAAKLNAAAHPLLAKFAAASYFHPYATALLDFLETKFLAYVCFGYAKEVMAVIAVFAAGAHIIEPFVAVYEIMAVRSKLGRGGAAAIPLTTVAGYFVFIFLWGVGCFGLLRKELARLSKN